MALGDTIAAITSGSGSTLWMIFGIVIFGGIALILLGVGAGFWYFKKRWNLKVEIKLPRSDGQIINGEWGKGFYDAKRGVVWIKRGGVMTKAISMKIFDPKKYLQGTNLLTVIQVGPQDYRPVLNHSWTEYEQEYVDTSKPKKDKQGNPVMKDGKQVYETVIIKESILNIKADTELDKAWKSAFEAAAKKAYSLQNLLSQYQTPIAIGIVLICCFVGFTIMWVRLPTICG